MPFAGARFELSVATQIQNQLGTRLYPYWRLDIQDRCLSRCMHVAEQSPETRGNLQVSRSSSQSPRKLSPKMFEKSSNNMRVLGCLLPDESHKNFSKSQTVEEAFSTSSKLPSRDHGFSSTFTANSSSRCAVIEGRRSRYLPGFLSF